jgi:signal peptidase
MAHGGRRKARYGPRTAAFWRFFLLHLGAALGVGCLVTTGLAILLGVTPIAFRSDSMAPAISAGDLALARSVSAGGVGVGDVVSVPGRDGVRVTHRVVLVEPYGSSIRLTLQADDQGVPDAEAYEVTEVDRVFTSIPLLGHLLGPARGLFAVLLGGLVVACLAAVVFVPRRRRRGTRRAAN